MKKKITPYILLVPQLILGAIFIIGLGTGIIQSLGMIPAFGLTEPTLKYYKEILDAISEENCFPDSCSGGGVYLREAILKKVPEITEEQLRMIWRELPFVIEKRTQDWIEREKQFSENYIRKAKKRKPGKTKRTADQIGK